ncbi:MAG: glycosyltransferase family 4 protein [Pseudomonadota bacterium]
MKILAVTTKSPWPLNEGRALRTYNLLKEAAKRHEVTLCTYVQSQEELDGIPELEKFCSAVHAVPLYMKWPKLSLLADALRELVSPAPLHAVKYSKRPMRELVGGLLESGDYDVLHLDMLQLAELASAGGDVPTVLVEHNVESQILARRLENESNPVLRAYLRYQTDKLRRYEARMCNAVQHVTTVSDEDREQLAALGVETPVTSVPNAVDTEFFTPADVEIRPDTLIYVGSLAWFPNEDAVGYFVDEILPRIAEKRPGVRFNVIGQTPDTAKLKRWTATGRVEFLGFVDDIRPHVGSAAVYVVPLRIGGGTRLKILDALSMSKALVSTSVGCEGLGLEHGVQAKVADEPAAFADAVVELLANPELAAGFGRAGRQYVYEHFRWQEIALRMEAVYEAAAATRLAR